MHSGLVESGVVVALFKPNSCPLMSSDVSMVRRVELEKGFTFSLPAGLLLKTGVIKFGGGM